MTWSRVPGAREAPGGGGREGAAEQKACKCEEYTARIGAQQGTAPEKYENATGINGTARGKLPRALGLLLLGGFFLLARLGLGAGLLLLILLVLFVLLLAEDGLVALGEMFGLG